ncbi:MULTISPECIES: outer membrane protein [Vibrio]|uniref:outer membrane protein n=1 Tax=Vibrio TaxID=662 RepID=UPI00056EB364|nr:outer membrane beta-barrel protein [Vibrio pacinii]
MKKNPILITTIGLVLLPSGVVNATNSQTSIKVMVGNKTLESNWGKNNSMHTFAVLSTFQPAALPFGIAFDLHGNSYENKVAGKTTESAIGEMNIGLRYQPQITSNVFTSYLGSGVSFVAVELEEINSGTKTTHDGTGTGYWVGGGIDFHFYSQWSMGLDARYSSVDVELSGEKRDAGGFGWGATLGYHF